MATSNISSIHPTSQASTQIVETTIPVSVSGRELQRRHRMQMLRASRGSRPTMTLAGSVWLDRCHTHVSSSFTGSASIDRIAENERRLVPASPSRLYIGTGSICSYLRHKAARRAPKQPPATVVHVADGNSIRYIAKCKHIEPSVAKIMHSRHLRPAILAAHKESEHFKRPACLVYFSCLLVS
jgi:hypothetical protein